MVSYGGNAVRRILSYNYLSQRVEEISYFWPITRHCLVDIWAVIVRWFDLVIVSTGPVWLMMYVIGYGTARPV